MLSYFQDVLETVASYSEAAGREKVEILGRPGHFASNVSCVPSRWLALSCLVLRRRALSIVVLRGLPFSVSLFVSPSLSPLLCSSLSFSLFPLLAPNAVLL